MFFWPLSPGENRQECRVSLTRKLLVWNVFIVLPPIFRRRARYNGKLGEPFLGHDK